jgi:short-subunit dehydrogenase
MNMEKNNLFKYATKELSQDAMICWIANWYNFKSPLSELSKKFINLIMNKHGYPDFALGSVRVFRQYGRIDVLVNNAGYGLNGVLELIPTEKIEKQFEVNVYGVINCTRYALPYMKKGSKVINMSSCMALFPMPYRSMYAASKSAVLTMSFSQRNELKACGIDVVALCPGNIRTNFTKNKAVVLETNERYGDAPLKAQQRLDSEKADQKRMDPIKVAKVVFKVANKKRTKPFYIISAKMQCLYFVSRFVPKSWLIDAIGSVTG